MSKLLINGNTCLLTIILAVLFSVTSSHPTTTTMATMATEVQIPEKFMGRFKLERSENFDEFLASKGVNWLLRKIIAFSSVTKVFKVSKDHPNTYDVSNLSAKKDTHFNGWKLGETFEAEGMDGKMHKVTFNYDPETDELKETHIRPDDADDKGETYFYTIDGDQMVMKMGNAEVTCKRYFKREPITP